MDDQTAQNLARAVLERRTRIEALEAENERLREIIRDYARHNEGCSAAHGDEYRCRCGWRDVGRDFLRPTSQ